MDVLKRFRTPVLIGAGALVFAVVLFVGLISPQSHKLSSLQTKEAQLQSQQAHLQSEIATLKSEKAHISTSCSQLTKALTEIPGTPDVSSFLQQVTNLAVTTGNPNTPTISVLQAPSSGAGAAGAGAGATPVQVSLTLNGNYAQMSAFITGLTSFPRLFTVTSLSVTGGPIATAGGAVNPATGGYSLNMTGAIYYSLGRQNVCQGSSTGSTGA
jgi:Tfp pilus assembly protein PilO